MTAKRLIFYGGSRENNNDGSPTKRGRGDNSAFQFAANNIARDYADWGKSGKLIKIRCAINLVSAINSNESGTLASLDILCHGTPWSLNFSVRDDLNCGLFASPAAKAGFTVVGPFSGRVNSPDGDCALVSDIRFDVFANNAVVELHGCQTAGDSFVMDSVAVKLSAGLSGAGKKLAVVIAHVDKANPNIDGTTIAVKQDYRHGRRVILLNGTIVHSVTKSGKISAEEIAKHLK
jgi:hypothetical protein